MYIIIQKGIKFKVHDTSNPIPEGFEVVSEPNENKEYQEEKCIEANADACMFAQEAKAADSCHEEI